MPEQDTRRHASTRDSNNSPSGPTSSERKLAAICAVAILGVVFIVILRPNPFTDPNQVVLVRIVLSLTVAIIGAVIPGFLNVELDAKGMVIRAGGALALFIITFFFSPHVLPLGNTQSRGDPSLGTKGIGASTSSPSSPLLIERLRTLCLNLDRTTFKGSDYNYWPDGGLRNIYDNIRSFLTYRELSEIYGRNVFLSGPHNPLQLNLNSNSFFGHYDPQFVSWLHENVNQILSDDLFVKATKPQIDKYLLKQAMLWYESYEYLEANPDTRDFLVLDLVDRLRSNTVTESYYSWLSWLSEGSYSGSETVFIRQKFRDTLLSVRDREDAAPLFWINAKLNDPNRACSAIYFWIRRRIDGTDDKWLAILVDVLKAYSAYPNGTLEEVFGSGWKYTGARKLHLDSCAIINDVVKGSQAASVGLETGDRICEYAGTHVANAAQLTDMTRTSPATTAVDIFILRHGYPITKHIKGGRIGVHLSSY